MFVSFVWFALAVAVYLWIDKPWYYALAVAVCVFLIGALARRLFQIARTEVDAEIDKALRQAERRQVGTRTATTDEPKN